MLGPTVQDFEQRFAAYCETPHCVAVNSGTSALHVALRCLDVGPGDEVILPAMTFVATAWAVRYVGATPVFVDIDPATRTLDPNQIAAAITPRTKVILPVHLYGRPADLTPILQLARQHKLRVVEDAAQAHGARYAKRRIGSFGDIACFSFYPGKNLGAYGEGGAIVTHDPALAAKARALRDHGQVERYHHEFEGYNYRMSGFQGAVLGIKLKYLDAWNAARRAAAAEYITRLSGTPGLGLPLLDDDGMESVFHLFVIETDNRDAVAKQLSAAGVQNGLHYPIPVHLQPAFADRQHRLGDFPVSERLGQRCLSLPMFPELTETQIAYVCEQLHAARTAGSQLRGMPTAAAH